MSASVTPGAHGAHGAPPARSTLGSVRAPGAGLPDWPAPGASSAGSVVGGVVESVDVLALRLGARITASTVLLACVVVIIVGAQSLLGNLREMDRDIATMNEQLEVANDGVAQLDASMAALPATARDLAAVTRSVTGLRSISTSTMTSLEQVSTDAEGISGGLTTLDASTTENRRQLEGIAGSTEELAAEVRRLKGELGPVQVAHGRMAVRARALPQGLDEMGGRLATVIRQLNWLSRPSGGGAFTVRVSLDPKTMPKVPYLRAETSPVQVFPEGAWAMYGGP